MPAESSGRRASMCWRSRSRTRSRPCRGGGLLNADGAERLADCADAPGTTRRARNHRCREAPSAAAARAAHGAGPRRPARCPPGTCLHRSRRGPAAEAPARSDSAADAPCLLCGEMIDRSTVPANCDHQRPSSRGCGDPGRARPHQRAAERRRQREPAERPAGPAARERKADQARGRGEAQERLPFDLRLSSANQAAMPPPKPTTNQGGSCARSASRSFSSSS